MNIFKRVVTPNIIIKEIEDKAIIILNRPSSLNALTASQNINLFTVLNDFENRKSVVLLKGFGNQAFCAGADLIEAKEALQRGDKQYVVDYMTFLNAIIYHTYTTRTTLVAILDGNTIGSGAGISIFAKYRIATERTKFSMPETRIGLITNAAGTYFLNRSPGRLGYYLGLTGTSLTGSDVVHGGYATHYCLSQNLLKLEQELLHSSYEDDVNYIINSTCEKILPEFSLENIRTNIDKCFSGPSIEDIICKLKDEDAYWAKETRRLLSRCAPLSLKVALRLYQEARTMSLVECLNWEKNLTIKFFDRPDRVEGTRIMLKDRNDSPQWNPSDLKDVPEDLVESMLDISYEKRKLVS